MKALKMDFKTIRSLYYTLLSVLGLMGVVGFLHFLTVIFNHITG